MSIETGRFRRSDRLLDARDFRRVLREGRRRARPELVVVAAPTSRPTRGKTCDSVELAGELRSRPGARSRLGLTVSRKVGGAVVRNRFKRRVREWFRRTRGELDQALDIVVIARRPGGSLSMEELDLRLRGLLGLEGPAAKATRGPAESS